METTSPNQPGRVFSYCRQSIKEVLQDEGFSKFLQLLKHGQTKFWIFACLFILSILLMIVGMTIFIFWSVNNYNSSNNFYGTMIFLIFAFCIAGSGLGLMNYSELKFKRLENVKGDYCSDIEESPVDLGDYAVFPDYEFDEFGNKINSQ